MCVPQNEPFNKKRYVWYIDGKKAMWTDREGQTAPWVNNSLHVHKDVSGSFRLQGQAVKITAKIECEITFEPPPLKALEGDKYYQERPAYYVEKSVRSKTKPLKAALSEMQRLKPLKSQGLFR
jgi:hypothetical protein